MAPPTAASIARTPPAGNPITRPASFGLELADGEEVEDVPEVGEPAPLEAVEPCEEAAVDAAVDAAADAAVDAAADDVVDAAVASLDLPVAVDLAVVVALTDPGAVM